MGTLVIFNLNFEPNVFYYYIIFHELTASPKRIMPPPPQVLDKS